VTATRVRPFSLQLVAWRGNHPSSTPHRRRYTLAWLLAQGDDTAPIPGTKRVSRIEENTAADAIALSGDQIARLDDLAPATGDRHDETNMSVIEG
jgi:diketogulonate reductase-like aldo/keto reductase